MKRILGVLRSKEWRLFQIVFWTWALARGWYIPLVPWPVKALFIAAHVEGILTAKTPGHPPMPTQIVTFDFTTRTVTPSSIALRAAAVPPQKEG